MNTPTERILDALRKNGCCPRKNGRGWSACCPAHKDRNPSLSVSEGDDGRALVKCFAGCKVGAVCAALGLKTSDLFPAPNRPNIIDGKAMKKPKSKTKANRKPTGKPFKTANAAVSALETKHGKRSALWTYHDAQEKPVGVVVRWDLPDGKKTFRPMSRTEVSRKRSCRSITIGGPAS